MDKTKFRPIGVENDKADNSVIAPVESGTTASRAYAAGEHFTRDSAFCTAKTAIAQGETFTLNTNYTAGTIGQELLDITNREVRIYVDKISKTVYNIPLSFLQQRHNYGCALVGAWDDLFLLFYESKPKITYIAGTHHQTATVTLNNAILIITFSGTVWDGISVLPL